MGCYCPLSLGRDKSLPSSSGVFCPREAPLSSELEALVFIHTQQSPGGSGMSAGGGPRPLEVAVIGERGSPSQRLKRRGRGRVSLCLGSPFT